MDSKLFSSTKPSKTHYKLIFKMEISESNAEIHNYSFVVGKGYPATENDPFYFTSSRKQSSKCSDINSIHSIFETAEDLIKLTLLNQEILVSDSRIEISYENSPSYLSENKDTTIDIALLEFQKAKDVVLSECKNYMRSTPCAFL